MEGDTVLVSLHTITPASSTGIDVADTLPIDDIYQQVFQQARQYISASALPDISDVILATSELFTITLLPSLNSLKASMA
jgi:hypothetical protein